MNITYPKEGFLEQVREIAHKNGTVLIFDETITGCRFAKGGAQELFGVTPDLATFGKGLGNGFPLAAIVGKAEIMDLMEEIFFSGTFGGETASLAAVKAVLQKVRDGDVVERLYTTGRKILNGVDEQLRRHGMSEWISISGHPAWTLLTIKDAENCSMWEIKTLFMQEVFKRGILTIGTHNISYAHTDNDVQALLAVYDEILPMLHEAIVNDKMAELLETEPLVPLFKVR